MLTPAQDGHRVLITQSLNPHPPSHPESIPRPQFLVSSGSPAQADLTHLHSQGTQGRVSQSTQLAMTPHQPEVTPGHLGPRWALPDLPQSLKLTFSFPRPGMHPSQPSGSRHTPAPASGAAWPDGPRPLSAPTLSPGEGGAGQWPELRESCSGRMLPLPVTSLVTPGPSPASRHLCFPVSNTDMIRPPPPPQCCHQRWVVHERDRP